MGQELLKKANKRKRSASAREKARQRKKRKREVKQKRRDEVKSNNPSIVFTKKRLAHCQSKGKTLRLKKTSAKKNDFSDKVYYNEMSQSEIPKPTRTHRSQITFNRIYDHLDVKYGLSPFQRHDKEFSLQSCLKPKTVDSDKYERKFAIFNLDRLEMYMDFCQREHHLLKIKNCVFPNIKIEVEKHGNLAGLKMNGSCKNCSFAAESALVNNYCKTQHNGKIYNNYGLRMAEGTCQTQNGYRKYLLQFGIYCDLYTISPHTLERYVKALNPLVDWLAEKSVNNEINKMKKKGSEEYKFFRPYFCSTKL